jgi:hypothetical protein
MKPCDWDSREKYELLIGPLRERARELGYSLSVHGTLKRDIDLVACPWTNGAADPKHLAEQLRLVAEKVNGYAQPCVREVSEYFLDGCPGNKDHGRLSWTWYLDPKGAQEAHGSYIDLSVMPRIREMHLDLVRERALTAALRADMCRTEDALEAEKKKAVADIENERMEKEKALSQLRSAQEQEARRRGIFRKFTEAYGGIQHPITCECRACLAWLEACRELEEGCRTCGGSKTFFPVEESDLSIPCPDCSEKKA